MQLEERKLKEIEHSDRRRRIVTGYEYETDCGVNGAASEFITDEQGFAEHFSNTKFYSITRSSVAYRDRLLYDGIQGCTALDYCCGNGEIGLEMAARGAAAVHGIDISPVAIDNARRLAARNGVAAQCRFEVMDAEKTDFADDTFDVVHEYGALHHLELNAAFRELARIVKPQGCVICTEALRHNPLIHHYRHRTPRLRTAWEVEHILGAPEIYSGLQWFGEIRVRFFHLAALGAVPFRKTGLFGGLLWFLDGVDNLLLRIPGLGKYAWIAVILYSKPKKD
ncbi:MAG: class I SAM-dependent methyltransferase [Planctomycetes bacterium]|nr:class I SAM-dependent methyltransferase [Planctomycetota bacterium]MCG2682842.1 class I SAM-dependent methyltransferase [Planctomycetales bacterium]